jgi:ankyrin repeat protein
MDNIEPDAKDNQGRTPLSYAVEASDTDESIKLLLAVDNVDPDSRDCQGRTPLSYAAGIGRGQAVELLLSRYDVNPDSKDDNGRTPIMIAKEKGNDDIVELIAQEIKARQEEQAESMSEENDNKYANGTIGPYPFDTSKTATRPQRERQKGL